MSDFCGWGQVRFRLKKICSSEPNSLVYDYNISKSFVAIYNQAPWRKINEQSNSFSKKYPFDKKLNTEQRQAGEV